MPGSLEYKLNRTSKFTGLVTTSFAAVEVYSNPGNPIYLDGISYGAHPSVAADVGINPIVEFRLFKDLKLDPNLSLAVFLAALDEKYEEMYRAERLGSGGEPIDFNTPMALDAGYRYTGIVYVPVAGTGYTANPELYLTMRGRTMPDKPVEKMPVELRTGAAEEPTQYTEIEQV